MAVVGSLFSSRSAIDRAGDNFKQFPGDPRFVSEVQKYRQFRLNCLTTSIGILNNAKLPAFVFVSARLKRLDSIHRKLTREKTNFKLARLDDVIGLRVICRSFSEAQELSQRISNLPQQHSIKDYTEIGANNTGYRCVHHLMDFFQKLDESKTIKVRFEIQVRSFYQHQWALWSEAQGEDAKLGLWGDQDDKKHKSLKMSSDIAKWEQKNPREIQDSLAPHSSNGHSLTVVWKQSNAPIIFETYKDSEKAISYLNYLEIKFPTRRNNALLLVGIASENVQYILARTHPLFIVGKISPSKSWMPKL